MKFAKLHIRYIAIAVIVILITIITTLYSVFTGNSIATEGYVYIPGEGSYKNLVDSLETGKASLKSIKKFEITASALNLKEGVRAGRYSLKKGMSYIEVVRMFKHGLQTPVRLTFNNIRTLPQLAGRLAQQIEADSVTLTAILTSDSTATQSGFTPETFPAIFIPDTYEVYWNIAPGALIERMKKEYAKFWNSLRTEKLTATGLSKEQAITLASIVYEESKMSDEMPVVAGVYLNRLRIGMPLQADPTVKFAIGDFSLRRILNLHLTIDSPYNTYINTGLPPGPICMPSVKAIDAVLNFKKHNYLYFCAKPDFSGYHSFASTLGDHNKNAAAYAAALNRKKIFK